MRYFPTMLIETHAHLDYPDFSDDFEEMLARATAAGVTRIITIGTSLASSTRAIELAERSENIYAVIGVHPASDEGVEDVMAPLRQLAASPRVVAIGETGLDYHRLPSSDTAAQKSLQVIGHTLQAETEQELEANVRDGAYKARQASLFEQQLDLAAELGLNVVIHQRDAWDDTIAMLAPYSGRLRGVFHCFGGSLEQAEEVLGMGHLVSFTGIVTFKNGTSVRDVAAQLPLGSFMVETDCPYLAPIPHRGQRAEPAHTRLVAESIATSRGVSLDEISRTTTATAESFFRFNRT
ncbi:TatD family hydrolase [soil metagenome]